MTGTFDYIRYDQTSEDLQLAAKRAFEAAEAVINSIPSGRYVAIAKTNLEIAYAMVGKAIRDAQIARVGPATLNESRG